jgi:2-aminoadipate transaminase
VDWIEPRGGLYVWAKFPGEKTGPKSKLFKRALSNDVLYVPGVLCYADDPTRPKPDNEMRLSFGGATEKSICTGIERLGEALSK